jgi:hypothetical protein
MIKSSKTPYEIRLDLLILAKEILSDKHRADTPEHALHTQTACTSEEVIAEAIKLNGFVSQS